MKKLFIQFYLLLFVCFLVMSLLVGLVYKFTAERAGKQSLDDLMNSSLYLMRSELRVIFNLVSFSGLLHAVFGHANETAPVLTSPLTERAGTEKSTDGAQRSYKRSRG